MTIPYVQTVSNLILELLAQVLEKERRGGWGGWKGGVALVAQTEGNQVCENLALSVKSCRKLPNVTLSLVLIRSVLDQF